jgi:hypothetical protein
MVINLELDPDEVIINNIPMNIGFHSFFMRRNRNILAFVRK